MDTLGVYVQVPFCASKCTFCNFSSAVAPAAVYDGYTEALLDEIEALHSLKPAAGLLDLATDSFYFGGGTPSLLGAERLEKIWSGLRRTFRCSPSAESTIEITPASADDILLCWLLAMGFNRLSIGAQSFADRELAATGRLHSAADTERQVRAARAAGFSNISLDLLGGLPFQTPESWRKNLESATRLAPEHVSVYLFEADEKSRLGSAVLSGAARYGAEHAPGEDFQAEAYETAREFLAREGYVQYEISNFARPGFESLHNRKYWELAPYLGLGAGAHSFNGTRRWANQEIPGVYEASIARGEAPTARSQQLTTNEQIEEFFFLGLRERRGVSLPLARARWGKNRLGWWEEKINRLRREGWITGKDEGRVALSESACLTSNEIFQEFLHPPVCSGAH